MFGDKKMASLCLWLLSGYLILGLVCYIPNMSGVGLRLPMNILCWAVMAGIIVMVSLFAVKKNELKRETTIVAVLPALILLALPLLWGDRLTGIAFVPKLLMLAGGALFYLALLQLSLSQRMKEWLIYVMVTAALVQGALALWQVFVTSPVNWMEYPLGTRPYGIFQQVNVLASFVATGCAGAIYVFFTTKRRGRVALSCLSIFFLIHVLWLLQSRAGGLGVIVYGLFAGVMAGRKRRSKIIPLLVLCAAATAYTFIFKALLPDNALSTMIAAVNKSGSNHERIVILKATWQMITQHPFSGWGYGNFEVNFARIAHDDFNFTFRTRLTHPHNELLYEWVEGGISALVATGILLLGYSVPFFKGDALHRLRWGLSLPCLLHMMLEYPLAQSSVHWLLLLLICRISVRDQNIIARSCPRFFYYLQGGVAAVGVVFLLTGLRTNAVLTKYERSGMTDFSEARALLNPWAQWSRFEFDRNVGLLMEYNRSRNEALLYEYYRWGTEYLRQENDTHVAANVNIIANQLHIRPDPSRGK